MSYRLSGVSDVMTVRRNELIALRDSGAIDNVEYSDRLIELEDAYYDSVSRQYSLAYGHIDRSDGGISVHHDGVINSFNSTEEAIDFLIEIGRIDNVINF